MTATSGSTLKTGIDARRLQGGRDEGHFGDRRPRRTGQGRRTLTDPIVLKLHALTDQQLAAIVDSSDDAILVKDLRGVIHSWNRGAERLFGYTAAEVIGKPVTVLIPPDREKEEPYILRLIGGGERLDHYRTVRCRKDGTLIDISLSVTPIRDSSGRVIGATKVARDVTEATRTQRQQDLLVQAEQRLAAIVESSDDAILSGDLDGVILTWNKGAERLFGYPAEDAIGKPVTILAPEGRRDEELGFLKRVFSGERIERHETARRRMDGTIADVSLNASPIRDLAGRVVGVSLIARAIAARTRS